MTIAQKLETAAQNLPAVYNAGKLAEHSVFWDALQNYGNRTNYGNMFNDSWNDDNFRPKYDIRPTKMNYCFAGTTKLTDLAAALENCGVELDTSVCTDLGECFAYSRLTKLPVISTVSCTALNHVFRNCQQLAEIKKLILRSDGTQIFNYYVFYCCISLKKIEIEGVIGQNFDIHWSTLLDAESLHSIVTHSSQTNKFTMTLPFSAEETYDAFYGNGAWETLCGTRTNITFAYA